MRNQPLVHASFEEPAPQRVVEDGPLRVTGWVFDEAGPLDRAMLVAGDLPPARLTVGAWRQGVASAFGHVGHAGASGFCCDLDLRGTPTGVLSLGLVVRTEAGEWVHAAETHITVAPRPRGVKPSRAGAAFTIVQNEPAMLPVWLSYYGRHFADEDLYILDHESTDGSACELGDHCRVVPVHRTASFDHRWLRGTVEAFQAFLLRSYETVLFTEVDEFVIADPRNYTGLRDYIDRLQRPAARCSGFNVVHQPGEPPIDFDQPILAQRSSWHASLEYSKRLLARIPLAWSEGFHLEYNAPDDPPDPELMLVHLHRIDYDRCHARHRSTATRNWSADDVARGDGWQNRISGDDEFERWFRHGPDLDSPRELIPEHLRAAL